MRLLESEVYRGKQIRVYIVHPGGFTPSPVPALGVRIDGEIIDAQVTLPGTFRLSEAMEWGHVTVDRLLSGGTGRPSLLPSLV
ncbi:hypothetical protein [Deinococcus fonticola]|uniref:hypothetical protein n=1 Tax=Deinococcus fonticola TaxID=2528713 RepID=UPI00107533EC|nr:hypothetical protein [Deinococcus fonticola]